MKLIKPSVEYIPQTDLYKHIELCSRVCYKSEDRITEDSAKKMVEGLIKAGHWSMLEHGTIYAKCGPQQYLEMGDGSFDSDRDFWAVANSPYSKLHYDKETDCNYVTTNYRVLFDLAQNDSDFSFNQFVAFFQCEPTEFHEKRYTMKFVCDIGTGREVLRHRKFSFANESTRYCNYHDKEITFIGSVTELNPNQLIAKRKVLKTVEDSYNMLIESGLKPEEVRNILPLCTKSELVVTGFEEDWKHFFDLRLRGTTGRPHPDMKVLAELAWNEFKDKLNLEL